MKGIGDSNVFFNLKTFLKKKPQTLHFILYDQESKKDILHHITVILNIAYYPTTSNYCER